MRWFVDWRELLFLVCWTGALIIGTAAVSLLGWRLQSEHRDFANVRATWDSMIARDSAVHVPRGSVVRVYPAPWRAR